jgi:hypothetical protein
MFAEGLVVREVEVVELGAVVVADQPGELLEMLGLELDDRRGAEAMGLLAAGDEGLPVQAAQRFASEQSQKTGPRGEAEDFLRMVCAAIGSRGAVPVEPKSFCPPSGTGVGTEGHVRAELRAPR